MTNSKHTPGPWEWSGVYVEAAGQVVAAPWPLWKHAENEANALLLAAAPDLLATAKSARLMYYAWKSARRNLGLPDDHAELNREIERLESAIAKATGETP